MSRNTDAIVNPGKTLAHGAYAYLPGTGPEDGRCSQCRHYRQGSVKELQAGRKPSRPGNKGRCDKYAEFKHISVWNAPKIEGRTSACKYFTS